MPLVDSNLLLLNQYLRFSSRFARILSPFEILKLRSNDVVQTTFRHLISGVFWPTLKLYPQNDYKKNPEFKQLDDKIIELVNLQLNNQNLQTEAFVNLLRGTFDDAITWGYTCLQPYWEIRNGQYWIADLQIRLPYNFEFRYDVYWNLIEIIHLPTTTRLDLFNKYGYSNDIIIGTWPVRKYGRWEGTSELFYIALKIRLLEAFEKMRNEGVKRVLIRPLAVYIDELGMNEAEVEDFQLQSETVEAGDIITLPFRVGAHGEEDKIFHKFQAIDDLASDKAFTDINLIITELKRDISRLEGITDSMGNTVVPSGSYAKINAEFNYFSATLQNCDQWLEYLINRQIVGAIIHNNYSQLPPNYLLPQMKFGEQQEDFNQKEMEKDKMAVEMGILDPQGNDRNFLREKYGYPLEEEPVESSVEKQTAEIIPIETAKKKRWYSRSA